MHAPRAAVAGLIVAVVAVLATGANSVAASDRLAGRTGEVALPAVAELAQRRAAVASDERAVVALFIACAVGREE